MLKNHTEFAQQTKTNFINPIFGRGSGSWFISRCSLRDSYTNEQREARLRDNPFSFLHVVYPGYKYSQVIEGEKRYKLVRNRYQEFKEDGVFMQEEVPSFYVYKILNHEGVEFNGIVAAASTQDYEKDIIKKHEDTLQYKEEVFVKYLKTVGFNAEPVLLTYPDNDALAIIIKSVMQTRAEYEFTTTHRDTHYLWPVSQSALVTFLIFLNDLKENIPNK